MILMLAWVGLTGLEVLLFVPPLWRYRAIPASVLLILCSLLEGALFVRLPLAGGLLILSLGLYRLFNLIRIASSHVDSRRLHSMTWRTSWQLALCQALAVGIVIAVHHMALSAPTLWLLVAGLQAVGAGLLFSTTIRQLRKLTPLQPQASYSDRELPTISVCIPARNETETLAACLQSVLASDYPKLEVIVLDDCSQDKTSEVIKGFAHDGVRFVHGTPPSDTWLAKNWAYQQLLEAASGEYLLFCGVDIRLQPTSIRALVATALSRNKTMLCVVPRNATPPGLSPRHSTLLQPMRYAWELAIGRRRFKRPPALSSCWLVQHSALTKWGGFAAASRSIDPERALARQAIRRDGYSFLASDETLIVVSEKTLGAQLQTAIRVRYPQLRRRPELVWAVSAIELLGLVAPLLVMIGAFITGYWLMAALAALATIGTNYTYSRIVQLTYRRFLRRGLLALPVAALVDIAIRNYSMWQYEFSEVYWKGRNVCLPVMEVIPRLPRL